jgi:CheY-like chemotaxis protein
MGGSIGAESEIGKGSTFWLEVPFTLGEPMTDLARVDADQLPIAPEPLRILVADDNRINQTIVQLLLSKQGHTVESAVNGREAVEAVRQRSYDLVLMDVQMPEMDGITATREIRALSSAAAGVPIVALTANAMPGQREEYLAAGMTDYVAKPIRPLDLCTAIVRAIKAPSPSAPARIDDRTEDLKSKGVVSAPAAAQAIPVLDRETMRGWSAGLQEDVVSSLLADLAQESGRSLNAIKSALAQGDLDRVQALAHLLKGMAGNVGAARLARVAASIEAEAPRVEGVAARMCELETVVADTRMAVQQLAS